MQWFSASVTVSLIAVTKVDGSDRTCPIDVEKRFEACSRCSCLTHAALRSDLGPITGFRRMRSFDPLDGCP
jgi:hypothetical protein